MCKRSEAVAFVQSMRISCGENHAAKPLQVRVIDYALDHPGADSLTTMFRRNEHVAKPRKIGVIGDDASKRNHLAVCLVNHREAERRFERPRYAIAWPLSSPIRLTEKRLHDIK